MFALYYVNKDTLFYIIKKTLEVIHCAKPQTCYFSRRWPPMKIDPLPGATSGSQYLSLRNLTIADRNFLQQLMDAK